MDALLDGCFDEGWLDMYIVGSPCGNYMLFHGVAPLCWFYLTEGCCCECLLLSRVRRLDQWGEGYLFCLCRFLDVLILLTHLVANTCPSCLTNVR